MNGARYFALIVLLTAAVGTGQWMLAGTGRGVRGAEISA